MKDADEEIQSTGEEPKAVRKRRVRKDWRTTFSPFPLCLFLLHAFGLCPLACKKKKKKNGKPSRSPEEVILHPTEPRLPSFSLPLSSYRLLLGFGFRYKSQTCWVLSPRFFLFFLFRLEFKKFYWASVSLLVMKVWILWREMYNGYFRKIN